MIHMCRSSLFVGELNGFVYALPSLIEEEDILTEVSSHFTIPYSRFSEEENFHKFHKSIAICKNFTPLKNLIYVRCEVIYLTVILDVFSECVCLSVFVCLCVFVHVCVCICMCVHVCVHILTWPDLFLLFQTGNKGSG